MLRGKGVKMAEVTPRDTTTKKYVIEDNETNHSSNLMVEKRSWCQVYLSQTRILTVKNLQIQRRFLAATLAQFCVGVFILVILAIGAAGIEGLLSKYDALNPNKEAKTLGISDIRCDATYNSSNLKTCYDFAMIGNLNMSGIMMDKKLADEIMLVGGFKQTTARVFKGNCANLRPNSYQAVQQGCTDEDYKTVIGEDPNRKTVTVNGYVQFDTYDEFKDWQFANPNTTRVGVQMDWSKYYAKELSYTIHVNESSACSGMEGTYGCDQVAITDFTAGMQTLVDTALIRMLGPTEMKETASIKVKFRDMPKPVRVVKFDAEASIGPGLVPFSLIFLFAGQLSLMMLEKERKLPDQMKIMGMQEAAYWTSWTINHLLVNTLFVLLFILTGFIFQIKIFVLNDFSILFLTFWLSTLAFTGVAFLLSAFHRENANALVSITPVIIIYYVVGPILAGVVYSASLVRNDWRIIFSCIPLFSPGFHQAFLIQQLFAKAGVGGNGLRFGDIYNNVITPGYDEFGIPVDDYWTIENSFLVQLFNFIAHVFLAWYIQNVTPNLYGKIRPYWFCLLPQYWCGKGKKGKRMELRNGVKFSDRMTGAVREEAENVKDGTYKENRDVAVEIVNLTKTFYTPAGPKTAVGGITYAIDKNQVFALLGHNGAGKSTTINMLVGNMDIDDGDALVFGCSAKEEYDIVSKSMGVCPQHDILWDYLSGKEHLELFAMLKGVQADRIDEEVRVRLEEVNLTHAQNVQAGFYSGGMKRRLSIAISLIGDPKIVYLDEPTTGMDPVTRRDVWTSIQKAKEGRVIMLTSHSMEEADVLGDKIGIMSHGRMQALGTPSTYQMTIHKLYLKMEIIAPRALDSDTW